MDRIYVVKMPDGSIRNIVAARELRPPIAEQIDAEGVMTPAIPAETLAEYDADLIANAFQSTDLAAGVVVATIASADIPDDSLETYWDLENNQPVQKNGRTRLFRDQWEWDGTKITVTAQNKNAVQLDCLRKARDMLLQESDGPMLRETETNGTNVAALKTYRQALRDLPQNHAVDPINALWPVKPV